MKPPIFLTILFGLFSLTGIAQDGVVINNKAKFTPTAEVSLHITAHNAFEMMITNNFEFEGSEWQPLQANVKWTLEEGDGRKVVSVKFKRKDGSISTIYTDEIVLDTTPPELEHFEVDGNTYINYTHDVKLLIKARDAEWIAVSNTPSFKNPKWLPYTEILRWDLAPGPDGTRTVYIKFKDKSGNETEMFEDDIILDTKGPSAQTLEIVSEHLIQDPETKKKYLNRNDVFVNLKIEATDAEFMMIDNFQYFYSTRYSYFKKELIDWELSGTLDGEYTVFAKFRDKAGNETDIIHDKVIIDTEPPYTNQITINKSEHFTTSEQVELQLFSKDAKEMMLSNYEDFRNAEWEPFQVKRNWELDGEDDIKQVFVKYRDIALNVSEPVSSAIILDRKPPEKMKLVVNNGDESTVVPHVYLRTYAQEAYQMQVSMSKNFEGEVWKNYHNRPFYFPIPFTPGTYYFYARFRDEAGNISEPVRSSIILANPPFAQKIKIDNDTKYCSQPDKKVKLSIFAKQAKEMRISDRADFEGAQWEPFATQKDWVLEGEDGHKVVYAQFKSFTNLPSEAVFDEIILDRTAPYDAEVLLNNGARSTFSDRVWLEVKAQEADLMLVSMNEDFMGAHWQGYNPNPIRVKIGNDGGKKTVYVRFKDVVGNTSKVYSASILQEVRPVMCKMEIDRGALYCIDPEGYVNLSLEARKASEMMISNLADFTGGEWEPLQENKRWKLDTQDGIKEVFVKFRSHTKTESRAISGKIYLDRQGPSGMQIIASRDKWGAYLNPNKVHVQVEAKDARFMQISEASTFANARWVSYSNVRFSKSLTHGNGQKFLYARFKDRAGNISKAVQTTVNLDRIPPENNSLAIQEGKEHTNTADVKLFLYSKNATQMRISDHPSFKGARWVAYSETYDWKLKGSDNFKTVYAQFKDASENVTKATSARIELDRQAPQNISASITEGEYCRNAQGKITLNLKALGATKVMLSNTGSFTDGAWVKYQPKVSWYLQGEDGSKQVFVKFADQAGNEAGPVVLNITLDRLPPADYQLLIDNEAEFATQQDVMLALNAHNAQEMIVSNNEHFTMPARWEPFRKEKKWRLTPNDEKKMVYVKFRDKAKNESPVITASVKLDTEAPVLYTFEMNEGATAVDGTQVTLNTHVKDAKFMMISNSLDFSNSQWEPYFANKEWQLNPDGGMQRVYMKLKDAAGNISQPFSAKIMVYIN
ncbi:hypothetical protein AAG747_07260 [Rapidithrix thailandica]|uniref:Ig-like domain-containing protein n=1 Tax=Rapidithrix thailandica TaxID=413964 RepID=A0AAW9S5R2_9BACT